MLVWMRNSAFAGAFKFVLMGLLLLAVGGMVFMDTGGFFNGTGISSNTVAKGGGVKVGVQEFDRTVRRVLASQGIGAPEAFQLGMINQILTSEIQNKLFTRESAALGLDIGDEAVKRQIAKLAEPLATEGRTKKEALQQILRAQNISEGEFVGALRQEMANGLLRTALAAPPTLTSPLMAQSLYRYDQEKRAADVIILKNASVEGIAKPTEDQLQKYYEANKQDFLIPETRRITLATLKGDMVRKNLKITDEQLKGEYDKNITSFTKPPRRAVEQAVLKTEDEAKKAVEAMKAGTKVADSNTQEYEQDGLLPEIATPVFAAEKGAVIGPVKTDLGWHVLKVVDFLPESVTPFADVKDRLREELESIAMTEELYQTGGAIEDRAAAGDKLEDIVNEYGMTTEIIGPFRQNGNDSNGKDLFKSYASDRANLIQSAYDFDEGEITPVVETADGQFHIMRIDQVVPDTYRDLKSVRAELETRWVNEQRKLANSARAKTALEALNAGKSLEEIAKQDGVSVQTFTGINRKSAPAAPLTPIVAAQIFATENGKAFSSELADGFVVGKVSNVTLPPATAKADEKSLQELQDLTGRSLSQDVLAQYVGSLTNGKEIKINQPVLQQLYGNTQQE